MEIDNISTNIFNSTYIVQFNIIERVERSINLLWYNDLIYKFPQNNLLDEH